MTPVKKKRKFSRVMFSSAHDNWSTPKDVYEKLNSEFHFNDDPCPLGGSGGLHRPWGTSTFVNPPYSEISLWVAMAWKEGGDKARRSLCLYLQELTRAGGTTTL